MEAEVGKLEITKIVVTGGPCGGKTTGMRWIQKAFAERGYTVLFVPETATELITGGVAPWTCATNAAYQYCQVRLQLEKERIFDIAASGMKGDKILIVCDRGAFDNLAYMTDDEFTEILGRLGMDREALMKTYAAVFHLVTAARGAEEFYTTANNEARIETVDQARSLDDKLLACWEDHPNQYVIDNRSDFEEKMRRLITEIARFLGEPMPYAVRKQFLIRYPDRERLSAQPGCTEADIMLTYMQSADGEDIRLRRRRIGDRCLYFETRKKNEGGVKRLELERQLTKDEYQVRMSESDPTRRSVKKHRYSLASDGQFFEIDVYPFWGDRALLEIELSDPTDTIRFPEGIKVIADVTDDERYSNEALARL